MDSNRQATDPVSRSFLLRHSTGLIRFSQIVTDFLIIYSSILGGTLLALFFTNQSAAGGNFYKLALVAGTIGIVAFHHFGLYRHHASIMNLLETRKIIRTSFLLFLLLIFYSYFTGEDYSRISMFFAFTMALPALIAGRFFFFKINQYLYLRGINIRNVLIFGAGTTGRLLFQSISHTQKLGYHPVGFFDSDPGRKEKVDELNHHRKDSDTIKFLTSRDQCLRLIRENTIQDIFISRPLCKEQGIDFKKLLNLCREFQVQIHFVPYLQHLFAEQVILTKINGLPFASFKEIQLSVLERFTKRCFDLTVSIFFMIFLAPVIAIIAILIKRDSPGPVLFRQERIGQDGIPFTIYKFRTMYADTPDFQISPTASSDERITRIGRLVRKMSLDELPQILNVLQGNMSLVGPRPEMRFIVEHEYNDLYRQRLRVKPGITGIWQISTDRTREIHEDISYDLFYVTNRSLLLDILILLRTVPALFIMRTY